MLIRLSTSGATLGENIYYEEEPGIWETPDLSGSNYSRYIYNQGLHTTELEWDLSSKEVNEFRVSLSYRDSSQ